MLWRCLDTPGHEAARIIARDSCWILAGSAVFLYESAPCHLRYWIDCDLGWRTRKVRVDGWIGGKDIDALIAADAMGQWKINGESCSAVSGCVDVDLNFSPSTNLLPIRRLNLEVGQSATVHAAWLRFPSFQLEPLIQRYSRTGSSEYRYDSENGDFCANLLVNEDGFVRDYPPTWQASAAPNNAFNPDAGKPGAG